MLLNPFTPTEIASQPNDFYGRKNELQTLERCLAKGSVVIHGPMGIGKSSLMARARLEMEGFDSEHRAASIVLVGNKSISSIDDAARCLVQEMLSVDQQQKKMKFSFGSLFEFENSEVIQNFKDGHHLSVALRTLKADYLNRALDDHRLLIIAIDEADKCPIAVAQLVRALVTHSQQHGILGIRFLVAGVTPFYDEMLMEDQGVSRFFYKTVQLEPMELTEAGYLIEEKLKEVVADAKAKGHKLHVDPTVISRVVAISGGHPHLLQLLGSHLVEHEDEDPDGNIDSRDLHTTLSRICYEDRASVYNSMLHSLDIHNKLDAFFTLLGITSASPAGIVNRGFPTRINRKEAQALIDASVLSWFVSNNILRPVEPDAYGLVDEFLRVRVLLDQAESEHERELLEQRLVNGKVRIDY